MFVSYVVKNVIKIPSQKLRFKEIVMVGRGSSLVLSGYLKKGKQSKTKQQESQNQPNK